MSKQPKVIIIEDHSRYELQDKINMLITKYGWNNIIDIQYSGNGNIAAYSTGNKCYSAMIIYNP